MSWVTAAAARMGLPLQDEFSLTRTVYPLPTRYSRCDWCGSTLWNLGAGTQQAADASAVHSTFCRRRS